MKKILWSFSGTCLVPGDDMLFGIFEKSQYPFLCNESVQMILRRVENQIEQHSFHSAHRSARQQPLIVFTAACRNFKLHRILHKVVIILVLKSYDRSSTWPLGAILWKGFVRILPLELKTRWQLVHLSIFSSTPALWKPFNAFCMQNNGNTDIKKCPTEFRIRTVLLPSYSPFA